MQFTFDENKLNELTILFIESEMLELFDYKTLINNFGTQKVKSLIWNQYNIKSHFA